MPPRVEAEIHAEAKQEDSLMCGFGQVVSVQGNALLVTNLDAVRFAMQHTCCCSNQWVKSCMDIVVAEGIRFFLL